MFSYLTLHLLSVKPNYSYVPEYQCKYHGWGAQNVSSENRNVICDASGKYVNLNIPGSVSNMTPHLMYFNNDVKEISKPFRVTIERPPKDNQKDCEYEKKSYLVSPETNFVILGNQERGECPNQDFVSEGVNAVNSAVQLVSNPQQTQKVDCVEYCKRQMIEKSESNDCFCTIYTSKEYHPTDLTPIPVPQNAQPDEAEDPRQVSVLDQPEPQVQPTDLQNTLSPTEAPLNILPPQYIPQPVPQYTQQDYLNYYAQQQALQQAQQQQVQQVQAQQQQQKVCEENEKEIKDMENTVRLASKQLSDAVKNSSKVCPPNQ